MSAHSLNILKFYLYRDKFAGFASSLILHIVLLTVGGAMLIKPVQYGVEVGKSGIEIHLVAAPKETVIEQPIIQEEIITPEQAVVEIPKEEVVAPIPELPKQEVITQGQDDVNYHSAGGAITEAQPEYLANPAPPYPMKARQKGWEGVVVIKATVDKEGLPTNIEIGEGSGYAILDEAALKTVKKWKFRPAKLGNIPVESSVQLSIRFELRN